MAGVMSRSDAEDLDDSELIEHGPAGPYHMAPWRHKGVAIRIKLPLLYGSATEVYGRSRAAEANDVDGGSVLSKLQ